MRISGHTLQKFISLENYERFLWFKIHKKETEEEYKNFGLDFEEEMQKDSLSKLIEDIGN
ncbi:hypothetical protein [Bacillus sp. OK048]|uniref:hypothetical protein n=1 Tax=Bacillus sp. OK048 TaxID=1882761 RepID=UPI0008903D5C|nr:hypothetical protein [Bacillus sp. OK048]SDN63158.1 hypothetical protein SAMN05443253_11553 [Bacillus sp. OK048]